MSWQAEFDQQIVNIDDPNPWLALYLDQSLPLDDTAKRSLLRGHNSCSRRLFLPVMRPFARLMIMAVKLLRIVIPGWLSSSKLLHQLIYWGLKYFVTADSNYLILRHFTIGTEILNFIADNAGVEITSTKSLRPTCLEDLKDDTFLIHDLNIYNFIIELNQKLQAEHRSLQAPAQINFDAITDGEFDLDLGQQGWSNFVDLQSAIEVYTPVYALFLSDHDFWRATNSLQLDETIAIYISKLLNDPTALSLVNNRHPCIPLITLHAGFRLMLHGMDAEILHGYLRQQKRLQVNLTA